MSLIIDISVNRRDFIGIISCRRIQGTIGGKLNQYECIIKTSPHPVTGTNNDDTIIIDHDYNDSALELIRKALDAIDIY